MSFPKTIRTYYGKPYLAEIYTKALEIQPRESGYFVLPEATVFYPGGGGQQADCGTVNGSTVLKLVNEDGRLWHVLENKLPAEGGSELHLAIDWKFRYANMQQHTAQHLLSALLDRQGLATTSVHLGSDYLMIELDRVIADEQVIDRVTAAANQAVGEAGPVSDRWLSPEEMKQIQLRREAGTFDAYRLVEIEGYDLIACGGTHVQKTSEIGLILYLDQEKIRGHSRLRFLSGAAAYHRVRQLTGLEAELKTLFNTGLPEFPARLQALTGQLRHLQRQNENLENEIAGLLGREILSVPLTGFIFYQVAEGRETLALSLAERLSGKTGQTVFILSGQQFVLQASRLFDLDGFLKYSRDSLGLRGGGRDGLARGRLEISDPALIKKALSRFLPLE